MARQPDIRPYRGKRPQIAESAYIDPAAVIIGDVVIGEDSSVWPCSVVRGDVHYIRIGARTNIQDGCVLHVMRDEWPLILGDDVTIGHSVTLHGCNIASRCLVGMGAVILNGVTIGAGSIVAAGTLITERTAIPAGSLVMGSPGKVKRMLTGIDQASIDAYAQRYVGYKAQPKKKKSRASFRPSVAPATFCRRRPRCGIASNKRRTKSSPTLASAKSARLSSRPQSSLHAVSGVKPTSSQRRCTLLSTVPKN